MRLLLDTHAFLWWVTKSAHLSARAHSEIANPASEVFVSVIAFWEIAIKKRLGRLVYPDDFAIYTREQLAENGFRAMALTLDHVVAVHSLPLNTDHRDPFDRMLVAQATVEDLALVSGDKRFDIYNVKRLW